MAEHCPDCGFNTDEFVEGRCPTCHFEQQSTLDEYNVREDWWRGLSEDGRSAQIQWAMR